MLLLMRLSAMWPTFECSVKKMTLSRTSKAVYS